MQATPSLDDINAELSAAAEAAREGAYLPAAASKAHPFQRAGLGRAPYKCTGVDDAGSRDERCSYCTTPIRYVYHIEGADGTRFQVGSECVKQTGGEVEGFEKFNRQMTARIRALQAEAKAARTRDAWKAAHEAEYAYIVRRAEAGSSFYQSFVDAIAKWGDLSEGRLGCVRRDMEREQAAKLATKADPAPVARPVVNLEPVEAAFAKAKRAGIKWPKLRMGDFVFSPAGANSANAGAIYVKTQAPAGELPGVYLGKVAGGRLFTSRECTDAQRDAIVAISADPAAAAVAYGKRFGRCSVCNRELSDAESVERGIGPICAEKYGF